MYATFARGLDSPATLEHYCTLGAKHVEELQTALKTAKADIQILGLTPERTLLHECIISAVTHLKMHQTSEEGMGEELEALVSRMYDTVLPNFKEEVELHTADSARRLACLDDWIERFSRAKPRPETPYTGRLKIVYHDEVLEQILQEVASAANVNDNDAAPEEHPAALKEAAFPEWFDAREWAEEIIDIYAQIRRHCLYDPKREDVREHAIELSNEYIAASYKTRSYRELARQVVEAYIEQDIPETEKIRHHKQPHAVFVTSHPGGGKSYFLERLFDDEGALLTASQTVAKAPHQQLTNGSIASDYVKKDPDSFFPVLFKYAVKDTLYPKADMPQDHTEAMHQETTFISKRIAPRLHSIAEKNAGRSPNYAATATDPPYREIEQALDRSATITNYVITQPRAEALKVQGKRFAKDRRTVPEDVVRDRFLLNHSTVDTYGRYADAPLTNIYLERAQAQSSIDFRYMDYAFLDCTNKSLEIRNFEHFLHVADRYTLSQQNSIPAQSAARVLQSFVDKGYKVAVLAIEEQKPLTPPFTISHGRTKDTERLRRDFAEPTIRLNEGTDMLTPEDNFRLTMEIVDTQRPAVSTMPESHQQHHHYRNALIEV